MGHNQEEATMGVLISLNKVSLASATRQAAQIGSCKILLVDLIVLKVASLNLMSISQMYLGKAMEQPLQMQLLHSRSLQNAQIKKLTRLRRT